MERSCGWAPARPCSRCPLTVRYSIHCILAVTPLTVLFTAVLLFSPVQERLDKKMSELVQTVAKMEVPADRCDHACAFRVWRQCLRISYLVEPNNGGGGAARTHTHSCLHRSKCFTETPTAWCAGDG